MNHAATIQDVRSHLLRYGVIGGFVAGATFGIIEMLSGLFAWGDLFAIFRTITSVVTGQSFSQVETWTALLIGLPVHFIIAVILGVIGSYLILGTSLSLAILTSATLYGAIFWIVNVFVISPMINGVWFTSISSMLLQFLWHTFAFGTVLGLYFRSVTHEEHV